MKSKGLSKGQISFVGALEKAKIHRNQAYVLAYLANKEDATSMEIQKATGVKQPEVSMAVTYLEERGWISKKSIHLGKSGRPHFEYRLQKSVPEILDDIEETATARIREIRDTMDHLRKAAEGL